MKKTIKNISKGAILSLIVLVLVGCEDLLEQKPKAEEGRILPSEAVQTGQDLQDILVSSYDVLANAYDGRVQNPNNLLADNLIRPVNNDDYVSVWLRGTTIFNGTIEDAFQEYYIAVLRANTVLDNLDVVSELSAQDRNRMEAEARFIRALCHFDAVRSWAHPYGYTSNNSHPGVAIRLGILPDNAERASVAEVYSQVLADINFAKERLPEVNDVYASSWSAKALEAEVRFQMHDYQRAYDLANELILSGPAIFDSEVNKYQFPNSSPETLFGIVSAINPNGNVDQRNDFFTNNYNSNNNPSLRFQEEFYDEIIALGPDLPRASLFIENNQDGNITYMTTMMNAPNFNVPIFTVTQMMLIRAESSAELGLDLGQAISDINEIRERAYDSSAGNLLQSASQADVIEAARKERRLEFPCNGQRYHDIKRIGSQGEDILVREVPWDCNGMILQFPSTEGTDLFPLNPGGGC